LFLRWLDVDDTGFDNGLAIDDLFISFSAVTSAPPGSAAFSVLTYNTHGNHIEDWTTNSPQVRAIGRQMQYLQPDIITFQEIPFTNTHQMVNFVLAFLPGYQLATNSGTDGFIRCVILSRFPIVRSQKWLDGVDLDVFGYTNGNFTRDLFEAQIAVPGFPQPLHVFTTHLKAGTSSSDDAARRAAEAGAISNYFVTTFLTTNALHPYLLTGDLNEDIAIPATGSQLPIQRLTNGTGLRLTTPLNPISGGAQTFPSVAT
jgi:endonuclease/exonuclease/phosphatase family metal-dependent hydrolase